MNKSINFTYKYNSTFEERINLIERVGFSGVFIYSQYNPVDYIDLIRNSSLSIESLHLPYKKIKDGETVDSRYVNVLWKDTQEANEYVAELIREVEFAREYGIDTVVMHITGGSSPPPMNLGGVDKIARVLEVCEKHDITLCLENLRRLDYLDYVFSNLHSDRLMFCFDSGHANVMTKNVADFPWDRFGSKLYYLHINDNNGVKDEHLIPYHGNIVWSDLIKTIFNLNDKVNLTLEVRSSEEMRSLLSEEKYLEACYESLRKLELLAKK